MFGLGMTELIIILAIVVLVFGAGRLPQLGGGIGKGISNFKKEIRKSRGEIEKPVAKEQASRGGL